MRSEPDVTSPILNFGAGVLATIGGIVFAFLSYSDSNQLIFYAALIMLISGIVWSISAALLALASVFLWIIATMFGLNR